MSSNQEEILRKIKYLGLNTKKLPSKIRQFKPIEFSISKNYDENIYKQYKYVDINDIEILLTPANRLDNIKNKYSNCAPLICYLDTKNKINHERCKTFMDILKNADIDKIEEIAKEQENLNKRLTFKLSYKNDYLWQIYYSQKSNKYFMLYPTNDNESQALLYLIKMQIECENKGESKKIFVPIINLDYSGEYLSTSELSDIDNYLALLTHNWPHIYELTDKNSNRYIQIYGQTKILDDIKSDYRIILPNKKIAQSFYKILKAMFILQNKFPNYFKFETNIAKDASIEFVYDGKVIDYTNISKFVNNEYKLGTYKIREIIENVYEYSKKLELLKSEITSLESEYLDKEKQISTFLECKKTFFGKVKYYFKYSKSKDSKNNVKKLDNSKSSDSFSNNLKFDEKVNQFYTIDDLLELYKQVEKYEEILKTILMDLNALKLKHKNMKSKLQNAKNFIADIEKHKKSIFEFWKYSNKDEVDKLAVGEVEVVENYRQISKVFDIEQDLEKFGVSLDKYMRDVLKDEMFDSIFVTTTHILPILNKLKTKSLTNEQLEKALDDIKKELIEVKKLSNEEYDIFGGYENDNTKVYELGDKKHRENPRDLYTILNVSSSLKKSEFLAILDLIISNIEYALEKVKLTQDISIYKALSNGTLNEDYINIFDLDSDYELDEQLKTESLKIILYKFNLKAKTEILGLTNQVFFNNDNKTLPLGMDKSSRLIFDISKYNIVEKSKKLIRKVQINDPYDDFSNLYIKSITVKEYDVLDKKEDNNNYYEKLKQAKENLSNLKENRQFEQQVEDDISIDVGNNIEDIVKENPNNVEDNKLDNVNIFESCFNGISKTEDDSNILEDIDELDEIDLSSALDFMNFGFDDEEEVKNNKIADKDKVDEIDDSIADFEKLLSSDDEILSKDKTKTKSKTKTTSKTKSQAKKEPKEQQEKQKQKKGKEEIKQKEEIEHKEEIELSDDLKENNTIGSRISDEILKVNSQDETKKKRRKKKQETQTDIDNEDVEIKNDQNSNTDVPNRSNLPKSRKRDVKTKTKNKV